jgi:hypothetical protein
MRTCFLARLAPSLMAALALATAGGCSETAVEPDRRTLPIMPLAVGNVWIGRSYGLDSLGGPTGVEPDTLTIVSSESIDGETWFRASDDRLLIGRSDGLWVRASTGDAARHLALHPASVGDVFGRDTVELPLMDTTVVFSRIVNGVGTGMTVIAGEFKVNEYREQVASLAGEVIADSSALWRGDEEFYAPGVGRVKAVTYRRTIRGIETWRVWELVEARLK